MLTALLSGTNIGVMLRLQTTPDTTEIDDPLAG